MNTKKNNNSNNNEQQASIKQKQITTSKSSMAKSHYKQNNMSINEATELNNHCFVLGYN